MKKQTIILVKRVYEPFSELDGYRVLIDRLWPRGIKKEFLKYDLWAKDIAPSPNLRKWFHENPETNWDDFVSGYELELSSSEDFTNFVQQIKSQTTVTLLYAAKDETHNHAIVLQSMLIKALNESD